MREETDRNKETLSARKRDTGGNSKERGRKW